MDMDENNQDNEMQFQESQYGSNLGQAGDKETKISFQQKLVDLIIKFSGGKINENQATLILFGVAGFFVVVALFLIINSFGGESEKGYLDSVGDELPENIIVD